MKFWAWGPNRQAWVTLRALWHHGTLCVPCCMTKLWLCSMTSLSGQSCVSLCDSCKEELEKARWNSHCHNSHIFLFKCCFKAQTLKENNDKILAFSKLASVLICYRRKSKKCWRPKTAAAELHFVSVNISWSHALQLARFESPGGFFLRSLPDLQHLNKHAGTHSFIAFLQFLLL